MAVARDDADFDGLYRFIEAAGALKDTLRSAHTQAGRVESVAEHSWRLGLLACVLAPREPGLDALDILKLCLIHDLGEAIGGDVPAPRQVDQDLRQARERQDFLTLVGPLPEAARAELTRLYDDYLERRTPEARFVKAVDKLETLITHAEGANPAGFEYSFNLAYGRDATDVVPIVASMRCLADAKTRARMGSIVGNG